MTPRLLFDNFNLLADAPNGIEKLRELILQLAVQGKLVKQDPKDELASVLLANMRQEKIRLTKEKKIKKTIELPEINKDEEPFEIPQTWEWIRLNDIGDWGSGSTPDRTKSIYYDGDIIWLKSGELRDDRSLKDSEEKITRDALKDCSLRENKSGDVLIAMYGATVGKLAILEVEATTNQAVCACTCFKEYYNQFLFYLLMAYRNYFINESAGAAQPNFSKDKIIRTIAPLPPLAEQLRIVAKVDELMALCDKLDEQKKKKQEIHTALNESVLAHLIEAKDTKEFATHWQRICDQFELLYDATGSVDKLRSTILQLAVQGKLVKQDPKDEPAYVLLEKIQEEKERLIAEKKIKKSESLSPIKEYEIPYELPDGWIWARLHDAVDVRDGTHDSPKYIENGIPLVTSKDFKNGEIDFSTAKRISKDDHNKIKIRSNVENEDILFSMIGGNIGNMVMVNTEKEFSIKNVALFKYYDKTKTTPKYLMIFLRVMTFEIQAKAIGGAQPFVSLSYLRNRIFPLPPLAEQNRIITKIDQLLSFCDELEAKLTQAEPASENLLTAVVREIVEIQ